MRTVYVDPAVLVQPPTDGRRPASPAAIVAVPGAAEALAHLADIGFEVTVVGSLPERVASALPVAAGRVDGIPTGDAARGSWYLVADPELCRAHRQAGLRTVYVGPRRPPEHRPAARCDVEARDLGSAVMEILSADAMTR